jgi:hypothetical protein
MYSTRAMDDVADELHNFLMNIHQFMEKDLPQRERDADDRARHIAQAHRDGYQQVARAIDGGLRAIADAIRDSGR